MRRALTHLDPAAERLEGPSFLGWLRRPATAQAHSPIVVVIPGLDSSKEEFHDLIDALLQRGAAVFAMDGPGQGVLAAASTVEADYQRVLTKVVDMLETRGDLDTARLGVIGLSLGGYYAAVSAAHEPRIKAAATVSGPYRLTWDELPPFVTETLTQRAGSPDAARKLTTQADLCRMAGQIACPLRVIDGGLDVIPGFVNGEALANQAPHGEYLLVPHGDHLLGNARADWLPSTADWLIDHLA
jgi:dipeptidyl aminopeptidase/acylaminoacyl peptidase